MLSSSKVLEGGLYKQAIVNSSKGVVNLIINLIIILIKILKFQQCTILKLKIWNLSIRLKLLSFTKTTGAD